MPRAFSLLLAIAVISALATVPLAQDSPAPKPVTPAPGKVPPAFRKLYPQLEERKLYSGAVQYTEETLAALKEAKVARNKWFEKRTAFFSALTENLAFRGFPSASGEREIGPAECGNEFLLITVPGGEFETEKVAALAKTHGLKLLEFIESSAAIGLRAIDPGFTEEAIRAFWVSGREVKWTLTPAPEISRYTVNGVEKTEKRQWTGTCTTTCSEISEAGFKLGSSYSLKSGNSSRSGSSSARVYSLSSMQLTQVPIKGHFAAMPWLDCLSTRTQETLKIDDKEYACTRFATRPTYADASEGNYEYAEFYFCAEVPGVPLMVERFVVANKEKQTWSQVFNSTQAPK